MDSNPSSSSSAVSKAKRRPITRNRESLACLNCRARKLKCDRGQPCGTCTRREEPEACTYARAVDRDELSHRARISQGEARLQHLERLVEEFINCKATATTSTSTSAAPPAEGSTALAPAARDEYASMDAQMTENGRFLGSTHYSAMLDDIQELKDILHIAGDNYNDTTSYDTQNIDEFSILFGGTPCPTVPTVLSRYLPSRAEADRRVATYFRSQAIAAPYLHVPQFYRQYQAFWEDQFNTSPLWISMLFSICQLSRSVGAAVKSQDDPYDRDFSVAAAYCLAAGHYHRPQRFAVESLLVYLQCNISTRLDLPRDSGTLLGIAIRIAYTMGYHRDPDHFKHLSVFEGEMRRRTWAVCLQLDLLVSFQLGLPNNIQPDSWDTRSLTNLLDSDLEEDTPVLPPGRAATEPTQAMFYNAKQQLMNGFPKVLKLALAANQNITEAELVAVDTELRQSYDAIPAALHWRNLSSSMVDPMYVVVTRRCLELLYQKCLCVLHRRHVAAGREASIRICHDAASMIVRTMLDMYPEVQPGGQLWAERWLAFGALTWNDFLLGLMVLCLILRQHRRQPVASLAPADVDGMLARLRASRDMCVEKAAESRECHRIIRLLDAVLADEAMPVPTPGPASSMGGVPISSSGSAPSTYDVEGRVWSPVETNIFDVAEWAFLDQSFEGNLR